MPERLIFKAFVEKRFSPQSKLRIEQALDIIETYRRQNYDLTLRQLYYQFVARGLIPNTIQNYNNLGALVTDARLAGKLPWNAIEDRTGI